MLVFKLHGSSSPVEVPIADVPRDVVDSLVGGNSPMVAFRQGKQEPHRLWRACRPETGGTLLGQSWLYAGGSAANEWEVVFDVPGGVHDLLSYVIENPPVKEAIVADG